MAHNAPGSVYSRQDSQTTRPQLLPGGLVSQALRPWTGTPGHWTVGVNPEYVHMYRQFLFLTGSKECPAMPHAP